MIAKNGGAYFKMVNDIVYSEYKKNPNNLRLINRDITEILTKELIKNNKTVPKKLSSAVSKATTALVEEKKIVRIGGFFYPNIAAVKRPYIRPHLVILPFKKDGIFFVSPSTILLSIEGFYQEEKAKNVEDDSNKSKKKATKGGLDRNTIKHYFTEYLSENCFSVEITEKYVVLLIKGTDDEKKALGDDMVKIVEESLLWQNDKRYKPHIPKKKNKPRKKSTKTKSKSKSKSKSKKEDASN